MPIQMTLESGHVPVKIYTNEIDPTALQQLENISNLPFIHHHVAAMPDVHAGIGATVGSVIPTKGAIIPAAVGVDIGCFVGETKIPLIDGSISTLQELAEQGGEYWIYTIDKQQKITGAKATAHLTRHNAELIKIVLDNNEEIICTPDHQFMLRDGNWCEAKDLQPETSLMPLYLKQDKEGYTLIKQPETNSYQRFNSRSHARAWERGYSKVLQQEHHYNHKVKEIKSLNYQRDVYCLNVPEYANFALAAGVFVHNCGMNALRLSLKAKDLPDNLKSVRAAIEDAVPVGFDEHKETVAQKAILEHLYGGLKPIIDKHPDIFKKMKNYEKTWTCQIGSLGSGNHFIELCLDENQDVWVMLHSGSRGIGNVIGNHFISLAKKDMERLQIQLPHRDLAYFNEGAQYFDDYVEAVHWAQDYAMENRRQMMQLLLNSLQKTLKPFQITQEAINCHHNYVNIEEHFGEKVFLTRKGAISARNGELGIIPGSMGAKSYIVRGKGNEDSFCSCSHGAGRKMSRTEARKRFSYRDLEKQTLGVECRKDNGVLDEIPAAYKDIDKVMAFQTDLVEPVHILKQIICVKG
jgi:tRNA-splicing ligase RtcB (3'-phosphate/5'-hydroxy nucleic acid ligase)